MNQLLENYIETVSTKLKSLPEAEREQQIIELRQHLETLVAANQACGEGEAGATEAAIQQFGSAQEIGTNLNRSVWRMRLKRLPESVVTLLSVIAAVAPAVLLLRFIVGPVIRAFFGELPLPYTPNQPVLYVDSFWTHSLFLSVFAGAVLFLRDGAAATARRLLDPTTVVGSAVCWIFLHKLSWLALNRLLSQTLIGHDLWDSETIIALSPVYAVVPPAVAAWLVTRISPVCGFRGVCLGLGVTVTLGLLDFVMAQGRLIFLYPSGLLNYSSPVVPALVSTMIFASLAQRLNRTRNAKAY